MRIRDWSSACALPIFKQVCNIAQGSTIDYTADGTPIREDSGFKSLQNGLRDQIQDACLAYARAPLAGFHRQPQSDDAESRRRMAAAILARLLFMPIESEVALFERFDQDVNLGDRKRTKLPDTNEAAEGLRRRGPSYVNATGPTERKRRVEGKGGPERGELGGER